MQNFFPVAMNYLREHHEFCFLNFTNIGADLASALLIFAFFVTGE